MEFIIMLSMLAQAWVVGRSHEGQHSISAVERSDNSSVAWGELLAISMCIAMHLLTNSSCSNFFISFMLL